MPEIGVSQEEAMTCHDFMQRIHGPDLSDATLTLRAAMHRHIQGCKKCFRKCLKMSKRLKDVDPEYAARCIAEGVKDAQQIREAQQYDPEL
jgi:hypothetical protein